MSTESSMNKTIHLRTLAAMVAGALPGLAAAAETTLPEVTVGSRRGDLVGVADAASEGTIDARRLATRPLLRPAEALETVPGLVVTQHSGDGKANQYFLRGFNLDHGSDFATFVAGMPVNMPSHAHGQGYMDLNFLIPELIAGIRFRKGVYAAEDGDFATAGAARIDYQRQLAAPFVEIGVGQNGYRRLLAAGSRPVGELQLLAAVEASGNDGPWEQPENLVRRNAVLRLSEGSAANGFALTAMSYTARWTATEHVPARAIDSGEIGRFGALSPHDGGTTHRHSLSAEWARPDADGASRAGVYVIDYGLNLFSAPSGFINGPAGDQHEQADRRLVWGGQASRSWFLGPGLKDSELTAGLQWRQDRIRSVGLYATEDRQRSATVRQDKITETAAALFVEARTQWQPWLRSTVGLRHDAVDARVTATGGEFNLANGGKARAGQTSPKLGVVLGPFALPAPTEFYANWGQGFHSNDARGATSTTNPVDGSAISRVPLLVRARGAELGLRSTPLPGWQTSVSVWQMALASELVFIGDEGVTEPKGASRRHGLEWSNELALPAGLSIDTSLALSQARFREANPDSGGTRVPNAIPVVASVGAALDPGGRWFAGARLRYLGAYPLEETGREKSTPFWMANLRVGYRLAASSQLTVDVLNLFDRKANDIEYWGGACTRSESASGACGGGIDGRLVHPLEPRTLRLALRIGF